MKKLAILLGLILLASSAGATVWPNVFVNIGFNNGCTVSTNTCSVSFPLKVTASDLLVACVFLTATDTGHVINAITGDAGTFADLASSANASAGDVNCGYILSAVGGELSVTIGTNLANAGASWRALAFEVPVTGSTFDVTAILNDNSGSTTQPGATISPTTRGDIIFQCNKIGAATVWLANRSYQPVAVVSGGSCWFLANTFNGSPPTFTLSGSVQMAALAFAFKVGTLSPGSVIF